MFTHVKSSRIIFPVQNFFLKQKSSSLCHLSCPSFDYLSNTDMNMDFIDPSYSRPHFQFCRHILRSGAVLKQVLKPCHAPYIPPYVNYLKTLLPTEAWGWICLISVCVCVSVRSFVIFVSGSGREEVPILRCHCNLSNHNAQCTQSRLCLQSSRWQPNGK